MTADSGPVPDDIAAPLLLLSRMELSPDDRRRALELCLRVSDWPRLIDLAREKFSLAFVYRHLSRLYPAGIGGLDLARLRTELWPFTLASLQVAAAQAAFHRDILAPLGAAHVYLKGPSLAARYYGDLGVRFARDVDVLVARDAYAAVVHRAVALGYRLFANADTGHFATAPRDIRAQLRYQQVAQLLSPQNVLIEVHRKVDKNQGLFDEDELLARAVPLDVQGLEIGVLPTDLLFLYVCYHSTRHTWSLLHWIADLDAMVRHPSFDRVAVMELARPKGMAPLVESCLELNGLTTRLPLSAEVSGQARGRALLDLCLRNLEGGMEVELRLRDQQVGLEMPFDWLLDPELARQVRARRLRSRLMPSYAQYEALPLPDVLQWLYLPTKPLFWLKWHLGGRGR